MHLSVISFALSRRARYSGLDSVCLEVERVKLKRTERGMWVSSLTRCWIAFSF